MAYSDYGGYAYRNGKRIPERSDATITPDGGVFGTPGMYPVIGMLLAGIESEEIDKRICWPHAHVVLGDGRLYVALYKQSSIRIYLTKSDGVFQLDLYEIAGQRYPDAFFEYEGKYYLDTDFFAESRQPFVFDIADFHVEVYFMREDNYYMYAKLIQPDGTIWHGWSGYGVGAGLEDGSHGYSTLERERTLLSLWPEAINSISAQDNPMFKEREGK